MTAVVGDLLARATASLRESGSPTPRLDAEVLLAHASGHDRSWLLAHPEAEVAPDGFDALLHRRLEGEPIAYLRGFKEWRSLRIRTDSRALIPRPETELLYELAVDEIRDRMARDDAPIVAWEVATGSGAVTLALALRFREALTLGRLRLIASDLSADALELAAENLEAHGVQGLVDLACADLLTPAGDSLPRPDVVLANLPYVPTDEALSPERGLRHEPRVAIDGGPDGLEVLRRMLGSLPDRAADGATVLLEIGVGQASAVGELAPSGASVAAERDLAGIERVVRVQLR
ncbi:MAG: peptide chain release factor N(5)-glutamine methyltransferase [Chloroflexota bacterium]|nr:peptide chain release factor N(5)-glutamine methyltransferase [Chloroflexota bacterium]